jgi:hypothetical protein
MPRLRPWLIPAVAAAAALALFVAGVVTWRMMPGVRPCPPNSLCFTLLPPHRLHPLRAELFWAASAAFGVIAVGASLRHWRAGAGQPAGDASASR